MGDTANASIREMSDEAIAVNFFLQGRYKLPRQQTQAKGNDRKSNSRDPLSIMGCLNYFRGDKMVKECPHAKKYAKEAAQKL